MRLIDIEPFEKDAAVCDITQYRCGDGYCGMTTTATKVIPTVDAVPVVRCKDCKHKGWIQEPCHGKSVDLCHVFDSCITNPDKCFCYYGERRADNG